MSSAILSVGIDIGTSTTQVIFSRIRMENTAGYFSVPRISIVGKELVYKSPVHTTPLKTASLLDGEGVRRIVEREYRAAGLTPAQLDTGAVIITGESARNENAALITEQLSGFAGEFVVSTAGPDLESIIAGKGSGAFQYSVDHDCAVVNLDIGGGTTNIVLFDSGDIIGKGCFDIGGRLIRLEADYTVTSVSPAAGAVAEAVGVRPMVGQKITPAELGRITDKMPDLLAQAIGLAPAEPLLGRVETPNSSELRIIRRAERICFSGGVADCVRSPGETDPLRYGDIGVFLGNSIRARFLPEREKIISASETIRATVVGAGTYTTSLSGSTITCSDGIFPVKNVPVLKLDMEEQQDCLDGSAEKLAQKTEWFLRQSDSRRIVLALPGKADPTYGEIKTLARMIVQVMDRLLPEGEPIIVILEKDIAKALGMAMRSETGGRRKTAAIDGVKVEANDYVDIGRPLMDGLVVPVVVKTLVFG